MQTNNKLREALEKCANMAEQIDCQLGSSDETVYAFRYERSLAHNISECARAALAEPVKNYEVGTAEELYGRYEKFCCSHYNCDGDDCTKCPLSQPTCKFAWAQMPYKERK